MKSIPTPVAVPLLAFAGHWEVAAFLIIAERLGKATHTPARDDMLSHATLEIGRGRGFGHHKVMGQIGAVLGPVCVCHLSLHHTGGTVDPVPS